MTEQQMLLPDDQRCCYTGWNTFGRTHETGCAKAVPGATTVPRTVPEGEVKALVTIEAVERLINRARRALLPGGDGGPEWAEMLLEQAADLTTERTCTAVKSQALSDEISLKADDLVAPAVKKARAVQAVAQGREPSDG